MLKIVILLITILIAQLPAFAAELQSPRRSEYLQLQDKIQAASTVNMAGEEFKSLEEIRNQAEELYKNGNLEESETLFSFATLKGELLLKRSENLPMTKVPLFKNISTAKNPTAPLSEPFLELPQPFTIYEEPEKSSMEPRISDRIVGGEGVYIATKQESLKLVASRLGVKSRDLARINRIKADATLLPGQKIRYNNRRIAPASLRNGIVVNIPDRNLYLFKDGKVKAHYPVALGIPKKKDSIIWRTPTGRFKVVDKQENPTWRIPVSIQKEMEENGEKVIDSVPPGPKNPLGKYAMRTTLSGILIHSTSRPASINSYSSHGCIRVMPEHMEKLFKSVVVPISGEIVYQPVKADLTKDGRVFLEVNNDAYEMVDDLHDEVKKVLARKKLENRVSWQRVKRVTNEKSGIAEDVTLTAIPD